MILPYEDSGKHYLKMVERHDDGSSTFFKAWARGVEIQPEALAQAMDVARLPFVEGVALMPDSHAGIGATVGSVVAMRGAIPVALVGVDIGCGMLAARLPLNIHCHSFINDPEVRRNIRIAIQKGVPHGRTDPRKGRDVGSWGEIPDIVASNWDMNLWDDYVGFINVAGDRFAHNYAAQQLGTLGTGNHFIEIDVDENGDLWTVVHSGSRGPGNKIGSEFIKVAQELNNRFFIKLPNKDLAYLPEGTNEFDEYMKGVEWAQNYAKVNRDVMTKLVWRAIESVTGEEYGWYFDHPDYVDCHHNYVTREFFPGKGNLLIARKGAIMARKGARGFIPGARGAMSFIVEGLGNEESFNSASHGAGRVMSRSQARKTISMDEDAAACEGIECNRSAELLDESKACYKPIEAVMEAQKDLVKPIHTLRQIINIKGEGDKDA